VLRFHTAVCLRRLATDAAFVHRDVTDVAFRALDDDSIERYLHSERPYDCAGSFKSEGLGIALFESIRSDDPTALIGLPLIALARMLREAGFDVP
jgi:septum formation protein